MPSGVWRLPKAGAEECPPAAFQRGPAALRYATPAGQLWMTAKGGAVLAAILSVRTTGRRGNPR
jgi:hypothetical protein